MIVTANQYAKRIKYSTASVTKKLKSQQPPYRLPGAVSVKKLGNTWMIELEKNFVANTVRAKFKKNNFGNSI